MKKVTLVLEKEAVDALKKFTKSENINVAMMCALAEFLNMKGDQKRIDKLILEARKLDRKLRSKSRVSKKV